MLEVMGLSFKLWKRQVRRADFWIVIVVMGIFFWSYLNAGRDYMSSIGDTVGFFSVFPVLMSDEIFILVNYACLLILLSDVPLIYEGMEYQILRISRMKWLISQLLYVVILDVTFFLLSAAIQLACYIPVVSLDGEWGAGIKNATAFQSFSINVPEKLLDMEAAAAFGESFLLCVLLGLLFALICFICNLLGTHSGLGVLICTLAIIWKEFCARLEVGGVDMGFLSPVGLQGSYCGYTGVSVPAAAAYYVFFCCLIVVISICRIDRTDIKCGAK